MFTWRSCWTISRVVSDSRRHSAHGLVIAANWYHKSVWCTQWAILTWMWFFDRVLFWCILHFVLYCIIDLSSPSNTLKMYLVISRGIKYKKYLLSPSLSVFIIAQRLLLRLHFRGCPTSLDWLFNGVFQVYESLTLPFSCGADLMASFNNDNNFNRIS